MRRKSGVRGRREERALGSPGNHKTCVKAAAPGLLFTVGSRGRTRSTLIDFLKKDIVSVCTVRAKTKQPQNMFATSMGLGPVCRPRAASLQSPV